MWLNLQKTDCIVTITENPILLLNVIATLKYYPDTVTIIAIDGQVFF